MDKGESSSSSQSGNKTLGWHSVIPERCICGGQIVIFTSTTTQNPYRQFFRCEAFRKENYNHVFLWVDEAMILECKSLREKIIELEITNTKTIDEIKSSLAQDVQQLSHSISNLKTLIQSHRQSHHQQIEEVSMRLTEVENGNRICKKDLVKLESSLKSWKLHARNAFVAVVAVGVTMLFCKKNLFSN